MKMFLISDNIDTYTGMRLAGVEGVVVHERDELKKALEEAGEPGRKRVGLKVTGRGIIREEQPVYIEGEKIGTTTSGTHCPYLGYPVAMALVDAAYATEGTLVNVEVRGRMVEAQMVPLPFYKKK